MRYAAKCYEDVLLICTKKVGWPTGIEPATTGITILYFFL